MAEPTKNPTDHYQRMLAEATGDLTLAPVLVPIEVGDVDALEVTNAEVGERYEAIEIGPFVGNRYLRVRSDDLLKFADKVRLLVDDLAEFVCVERDAAAPRCVCGARIAPGDRHCGDPRCEYQVEGF